MPIERVSFGAGRAAKRRARRTWIGLILGVALILAVKTWYVGALKPVDPTSDRRELIEIEVGQSAGSILTELEERQVIRSALVAKIHLALAGGAEGLQAGSFVLRPSLTLNEVLAALALGKAEEVVLTIPEGSTVAEIDALLARQGLAATGALLACAKSCDLSAYPFLPASAPAPGNRLEGYLFPDTYYVATADFDIQSFVGRLVSTFKTRIVEGRSAELAKGGRTLPQIVAMASLLERESRGQAERKIVSGILWKRFDQGMQLGVDAAVLYAVGKEAGDITAADLATDSPYNLRRERGLPPGAIGNPGLAAIDAALSPEASAYYYYLHAPDGQIHYGKTLDEHNANKARYLP